MRRDRLPNRLCSIERIEPVHTALLIQPVVLVAKPASRVLFIVDGSRNVPVPELKGLLPTMLSVVATTFPSANLPERAQVGKSGLHDSLVLYHVVLSQIMMDATNSIQVISTNDADTIV